MFRNFMRDASVSKSFGSGLTDINEVRKRLDYTIDYFITYINNTCILKL